MAFDNSTKKIEALYLTDITSNYYTESHHSNEFTLNKADENIGRN